jgi:hypothetical protein
MMTPASILAAKTAGMAEYLDGKTVAPEQGDYYLGRDGRARDAPNSAAARALHATARSAHM